MNLNINYSMTNICSTKHAGHLDVIHSLTHPFNLFGRCTETRNRALFFYFELQQGRKEPEVTEKRYLILPYLPTIKHNNYYDEVLYPLNCLLDFYNVAARIGAGTGNTTQFNKQFS